MAIEKQINTRIQLKYSTLAEWNDESVAGRGANLVLKAGEIGICAIPSGGSHLQTTPPAIMFKVGDGTTPFKNLPWASALAADVYAWARKSVPEVEDFQDIINAARNGLISEDSVVKTLNSLKGDVTIEPKAGETRLSVAKDGQKIQLGFAFTPADKSVLDSGITSAKVQAYEGYASEIADAQNTANAALPKATFEAFETTNTAAIAAAKKAGTDAANALSAYQTSNDNAVAGKVDKTTKVNGHALSGDVTVSKSDVGLGNVENKTLDTSVKENSGNYITSGAVKTYVDSAIDNVLQFKYEVVSVLPTAAAETMGKIYLVAHSHSTSDGKVDSYDEFITIESGSTTKTYAWERIGNTDINLTGYVNNLTSNTTGINGEGVVIDVQKVDSTINVYRKDLTVAAPTASGNATSFIDSISQAKDGKITVTKKNVASASESAAGLMSAADKKKLDGIAEGANNYSLPTATKSVLGGVKAGTTSGKVYGVDVAADGAMTVNVPWTNTDHNQTVKVGEVTFGADAAVELVAGTNVTVIAETADGANKIHINGKSDADINTLITNKINGLDVSNISGFGAGKTLKTLTETDGKIAATFQDISVTAAQVSDFNTKVDARINNHSGVDKVGTVTKVEAGTGLKITGTATTTPKVEIDDSVVFVFNCGSATTNID